MIEVAKETISGVKLPKIFKCPKCNRTCHLLRDDTSIYIDGNSKIKVHNCENEFEPAVESNKHAWW